MKSENLVIVPTTHWDREWYIPFNEYRAYLVLMLDKLIDILKKDPNFINFTLDGQTIPLEDYLEVRPGNEEILREFIKDKRISIGPMYVLPDEFLVSGESLIRNLLLGHKISEKFGNVMKAGYIPDPFGHVAQLPQILSGFEIPSTLIARGFGNEFNDLDMEFNWNAPGNAASVLAIHLVGGYFAAANLSGRIKDGKYKRALFQLKTAIKRFERYTATNVIILNNGSDHLFPQPHVPKIVEQWNETNPEKFMEINDFEYYIDKILDKKPMLKEYQGELRGGKYMPLLSGVFSARMWIKQVNTEVEYLYEKYTEPISAISWVLDKYNKFNYPRDYIWTGLKWLLKNHPHDSICGCSIDEVHEEMKIRFQWSKQIGNEIIKNAFIYLSDLIKLDTSNKNRNAVIIYNPLPWKRKDIAYFDVILQDPNTIMDKNKALNNIKLIDSDGNEIKFQQVMIKEQPRYWEEQNATYRISFIADMPALGYKVYYVTPTENLKDISNDSADFKLTQNSIENEFYKIDIKLNGQINVYDKRDGTLHENICQFEDMGDWGDEYDYSGPHGEREDITFSTNDFIHVKIEPYINGPSEKAMKIYLNLYLPSSLSSDRLKREKNLIRNEASLYIFLYKGINRIDFRIEFENNCKDHRLRVLFPSKIISEKVYADGHFYIVPRDIDLPEDKGWAQKALPTNHQKDFICAYDQRKCFAVFNKGLPEYEAIKEQDGSITFAITLLRCIEWLSRGDLATRGTGAGPDLNTPGAQCLGNHIFELALTIEHNKGDYLDSGIHVTGKKFNNPLMSIIPSIVKTPIRALNKLVLSPIAILAVFRSPLRKEIDDYLPPILSFLEIDNNRIFLSALKQSEAGDSLIVRLYNLSSHKESCILKFYEEITIKSAEIVNLLEIKPKNEIKGTVKLIDKNKISLSLEPHVITTIKVKIVNKN
ncbi:MAG: alpha-mannosidase [Promethearchaeota archaeon]